MGGGVENPPGHLQNNVSPEDLPSSAPPVLPYSIKVGRSNPTDAQSIISIAIPVFTETFAHTCSKEDMDLYISSHFTQDHILAELNNPNKRFMLAMQGDVCCGFSQLTSGTNEPCLEGVEGKKVELQRIYVGMEYHGSGLARLLMEAAVTVALGEGYEMMWLGVYQENKRAKRFYEKLGFERVGEHDFWLGSDKQTDDIYLRAIP
jgi:ribosomal protein S18 acetylase RimI-like enzyme